MKTNFYDLKKKKELRSITNPIDQKRLVLEYTGRLCTLAEKIDLKSLSLIKFTDTNLLLYQYKIFDICMKKIKKELKKIKKKENNEEQWLYIERFKYIYEKIIVLLSIMSQDTKSEGINIILLGNFSDGKKLEKYKLIHNVV